MAIPGPRTLGDLEHEGILRLLIVCEKCDRTGTYETARLVEEHGSAQGVADLLIYLSRNCPKRSVASSLDRCGAMFRLDVE